MLRRPPPLVTAVLPEMVLFVTVSVPSFRMQPPAASLSHEDQRVDVENGLVVRTPPGAAWYSAIAASDGEEARMSHSDNHDDIDGLCTVATSSFSSPPPHSSPRMAGIPP